MPYLLLGPDDFSKKAFGQYLTQKLNAELVVFRQEDVMPEISAVSQTDLFSKAKVFWFDGVVPPFASELPDMSKAKNRVVISVATLDKRKKENKDILANKFFEVKEFPLPHGTQLDEWIIARVGELGGVINKKAAALLAKNLGRDNGKETKIAGKIISVEEIFNLWQADSEIKKLLAYCGNKEITEIDVSQIVPENSEVDVFEITNSIADGKKTEAMNLLHRFLKNQSGADEKGAVIQLNALLSEQFRNVAMIGDFVAAKKNEEEILEITGWKSGRLFVIKKIAVRFPAKKVLDLLNKLQALDQELKSSSVPPKVLLDLIISQLFV